jgi:L-fuculose-phosphate aldolase
MTMGGDDFFPADFEGRLYFPKVPVFDIGYEEYVKRSPRIIGAALATHRVVISRGHGVYAWGENLNQAYKWTCSLEMSAMTAWLTGQIGPR